MLECLLRKPCIDHSRQPGLTGLTLHLPLDDRVITTVVRKTHWTKGACLLQPSDISAQPLNLIVKVIALAHLDADLCTV